MEIIRGPYDRANKSVYPVVAIGNFDGVHRGHQAILIKTAERAKTREGTGIVLTFEPHPLKVLAPALDLKFLMTFEDRLEWINRIGIQQIWAAPFSLEFANLSPEEFAQRVLRDDLGAKEIFVGAQFAFGKDRKGTVQDLQTFGERFGYRVHAIEPVLIGGKPVSSSRIREYLMAGHVSQARELLGRPYSLDGQIIPGARRGTKIGFPTANFIPSADRVVPGDGIYAVRAEIGDRVFGGATYIGTQPSMGPRERMVETHLFEPQSDLYGMSIRLSFIDWIRPDQIFPDKAALIRQIEGDVQKAKSMLSMEKFEGSGF